MAEAALILVRHGRPVIDPDKPPHTWRLCSEGAVGCEKLAGLVASYKPTGMVSSPEPKAVETAQILAAPLGLKVEVDAGLHEHKRPQVSFGTEEEFRQRIAKVFDEPAKQTTPGGESAHEAYQRIAAALAKHQGAPLVAVTHGTVMSLYLAERLGVDAHDLWRSLHMPDAFVLDTDGKLITRLS